MMMELTSKDIIKHKEQYKPKAILILVDELSEVMNDSNYKLVSSIQNSLGSIARLGRAAGVHLCLAPLPEDLSITIENNKEKTIEILQEYIINLENKVNGKTYNLPNYYENYNYEELQDQLNYSKELYHILLKNLDSLNYGYKNILWKDLQLGDIINDSVVIYIGEWIQEQCYKLIFENCSSIEASKTHLFKVNVYDSNKNILNSQFEKSKNIRSQLKEDNESWLCVDDIIYALDNKLFVETFEGYKIINYKQTKIKNVRCIQTTKGEYKNETY